MANWTYFAFVWAEKFKKIVETPFFYFKFESNFPTRTDFPTPD
jgi:hypothetical protein